jgi:hypothetical protein
MSLQDWLRNGWLTEHKSSKEEITGLLGIIERDLGTSQNTSIPTDWRFAISYNAALQVATAALAASGYRASRESHHLRTIHSLELTLGTDAARIRSLDAFRKKRNVSNYEMGGAISDREVLEMIELAVGLRKDLGKWLRANHPKLL